MIVTAPTAPAALRPLQRGAGATRGSAASRPTSTTCAACAASRRVRRGPACRPRDARRASLRAATVPVLEVGGPAHDDVQDFPAASATGTSACRRRGRWTTSFRLGNRLLGNAEGAAGLEFTPRARRCASRRRAVCLTGAPMRRDARRRAGRALASRSRCRPGQTLEARRASTAPGLRAYLRVARRPRRADLPRAARDLHARRLRRSRRPRAARRRRAATSPARAAPHAGRAAGRRARDPQLTTTWEHRASSTARTARRTSSPPTTSTRSSTATWQVHYNSARTGVRLIGPQAAVGAARRRRGRAASVEHPRQRLRRSARSTSPATCRSSSGPTARASAASSARLTSSRPSAGSSASSAGRHRALRAVDEQAAGGTATGRSDRGADAVAPTPPMRASPCDAEPILAAIAAHGARPRSSTGARATTTCSSSTGRWCSTSRCGSASTR